MIRKISTYLDNWKNSNNRKPLIIRGARQVGKTYSIAEFGNRSFRGLVKIDFEKNSDARQIFSNNLDVNTIVELLEIEADSRIVSGETLLFFDEIQCCPRALMALRYFYEDLPALHVIAAGSLLELEIEKISFPVGRVEFKYMYPLTFEEFLLNTGNDLLLKKRPTLTDRSPVAESIHSKFIQLLKKYFVIGGMPEAVHTYIQTKSFHPVRSIHNNLVQAFIQDIMKYENRFDTESLAEVIETITRSIGKSIKYTNLSHGLSLYKIKQILNVLEKILLIHKIKSSSADGLPLGSSINRSVIKLCFLDIGLLQSMSGIQANKILNSSDLLSTYKGSLCEQFIGQELIAQGGSQNDKLFYWQRNKKNSNAEVDFLYVKKGEIFPIEIKSGPSGKLKSLHLFLKEHSRSKTGYVFNMGNIGQNENIRFYPLYTSLS